MKNLWDSTSILLLAVAVIAASGSMAYAQPAGGSPESAGGSDTGGEQAAAGGDPQGAVEPGAAAEQPAEEAPPAEEPAAAGAGVSLTASLSSGEAKGASEAKTSAQPAVAAEPEDAADPASGEPVGDFTRGLFLSSEEGEIEAQLLGWVKPLFRLALDLDKDDAHKGTGFEMEEARFGIEASLFEWGSLFLELGLEEGTGHPIETYLDLDPTDGVAVLRAGLFYPFLGRQNLMNTTELAMADYAMAEFDQDLGLDLESDLGAAIHGMALDGIEYGVGVWNGENELSAEDNIDFELGGRIAVHPLALAGVGESVPIGSESDPEASDRPGLVIGVAALYDKRHDRTVTIGEMDQLYYDNQFKLGIDAAFKYIGLAVQWELFVIHTWIQDDADGRIKQAVTDLNETVAANIDGTGIGTYLQAGYFVLPRRVEVVARFDMVDEDTELRGTRYYPAIGATYYLYGNNLKGQLMYRLNIASGYAQTDPAYIPTSHDLFLLFQASI